MKALLGTQLDTSCSDKAILVNSSQEEGGKAGVWLHVRILNSLVFSLRTTVRAIRTSLREAVQVFSARRRIIWLGLGQRRIVFDRVFGRYGLCQPVRDNFVVVDASGQLGEVPTVVITGDGLEGALLSMAITDRRRRIAFHPSLGCR